MKKAPDVDYQPCAKNNGKSVTSSQLLTIAVMPEVVVHVV